MFPHLRFSNGAGDEQILRWNANLLRLRGRVSLCKYTQTLSAANGRRSALMPYGTFLDISFVRVHVVNVGIDGSHIPMVSLTGA